MADTQQKEKNHKMQDRRSQTKVEEKTGATHKATPKYKANANAGNLSSGSKLLPSGDAQR